MGYIPKLIKTTDLAADLITGAKLADDAIDSEHYADGSIDTAHIADDQITLAKMAGGTDGNIISYDASGDPVAIATGDDGEVLTSAGAGQPPAFEAAAGGGGITHASQWRLTTNFDGDKAPIDANLEEVDTSSSSGTVAGFGIIGSSMTESSGVFTFPVTGYWLVRFDALYYYTSESYYTDSQICVTIDDGGDWGTATYARSGTGGSDWGNPSSVYIVDVTDTSNVKVRFHVKTQDDTATCKGDTNYNYTYMTFIRLGDT